jgi:hypothetical protein
MSVKPDLWIRRMALEHKMIEPFEDRQVRDGVISYGVSSYGYDIRVADEFRIFTNVNSTIVDPKNFDPKSFVELRAACVRDPAQFVRAGALGGIFSHPAQRAHDLRGQVHLRALRDHRERDAVRARMGRIRDARNQQHHSAARKNLRERRSLPGRCSSNRTRVAKSLTRTRKGKYQSQQGIVLPRL